MIKSMSNKELFQLEQAERTSRAFANCLRKDSEDQDIVKIGYLHIKRPPGNSKLRFKAWQKKYFVLRDISFDDGVSTLEMFDTDTSYQNQTASPEYTLDLKNVTRIESYDESKRFPNAFTVKCLSQIPPLTLGCYSVIEKNVWMEAVNVLADKRKLVYRYKDIFIASEKERQRRSSLPSKIQYDTHFTDGSTPKCTSGPPTPPRLNNAGDECEFLEFVNNKCEGFLVKILPNTFSSKNGLNGDYYMNVSKQHITLTTVEALKDVIRWPIKHITKFKSEDTTNGDNLLTLEASLFAGLAEGSFKFYTRHGKELIKKVKEAASCTQYILVGNQRKTGTRRTPQRNQLSTDTSDSNTLAHPGVPMERSHSSPNILDVRVVFNSHRIRYNSGRPTIPAEPPIKRETNLTVDPQSTNEDYHSYLELMDNEKTHATTEATISSTCENYLQILDKEDQDGSDTLIRSPSEKSDIEADDRRDSGFSDIDNEDNTSPVVNKLEECAQTQIVSEHQNQVYIHPPNISIYEEDLTKQIYSDHGTMNIQQSSSLLDVEDNSLITPPPLPPKKRRESSLVFLDYVEDENKNTPCSPPVVDDDKVDVNNCDVTEEIGNEEPPPPIPERSYIKTVRNKTCRVSQV